ncbi:MAG: hypothetical protein SPI58_01270 [Candidatus Enteromonas sp.]|nr:hypothetical protein [Candidatus Enteromonas sp.]
MKIQKFFLILASVTWLSGCALIPTILPAMPEESSVVQSSQTLTDFELRNVLNDITQGFDLSAGITFSLEGQGIALSETGGKLWLSASESQREAELRIEEPGKSFTRTQTFMEEGNCIQVVRDYLHPNISHYQVNPPLDWFIVAVDVYERYVVPAISCWGSFLDSSDFQYTASQVGNVVVASGTKGRAGVSTEFFRVDFKAVDGLLTTYRFEMLTEGNVFYLQGEIEYGEPVFSDHDYSDLPNVNEMEGGLEYQTIMAKLEYAKQEYRQSDGLSSVNKAVFYSSEGRGCDGQILDGHAYQTYYSWEECQCGRLDWTEPGSSYTQQSFFVENGTIYRGTIQAENEENQTKSLEVLPGSPKDFRAVVPESVMVDPEPELEKMYASLVEFLKKASEFPDRGLYFDEDINGAFRGFSAFTENGTEYIFSFSVSRSDISFDYSASKDGVFDFSRMYIHLNTNDEWNYSTSDFLN